MFDGLKYYYDKEDSYYQEATSTEGINCGQYIVNDATLEEEVLDEGKYYKSMPQNVDIFRRVLGEISAITNVIIKNKVTSFVKCFTNMLEKIDNVPNLFPPVTMNEEEDSVFMEWVFKDFRIGFTFCEVEEESLWFMVANRNLEELTVSGDLKEEIYSSIIAKILNFVMENT